MILFSIKKLKKKFKLKSIMSFLELFYIYSNYSVSVPNKKEYSLYLYITTLSIGIYKLLKFQYHLIDGFK